MDKINFKIIYGTAWKQNETENLTLKALKAGFNAIDTANQRKHYYEEGVGKAIETFLKTTGKKREDIFIQTKFTYKEGQDQRIPFDPKADPSTQVKQSFISSLEHLQTDYIDSYVLHGPSVRVGLSRVDWEVWKAMEELISNESVNMLGVSNISAEQLILLLKNVDIKPLFVQNRCYARFGWDKKVRKICSENNIIYQGFSLLTANRGVLTHPYVIELSKKLNKTCEQIIFSFSRQIGMLPLTGTTDLEHMKQDLESESIQLTQEHLINIEQIAEKKYKDQ